MIQGRYSSHSSLSGPGSQKAAAVPVCAVPAGAELQPKKHGIKRALIFNFRNELLEFCAENEENISRIEIISWPGWALIATVADEQQPLSTESLSCSHSPQRCSIPAAPAQDPAQGGWGMKSLLAEEMAQLGCKQHLRKDKPWDWLSRKAIIISLVTGAWQVGSRVKWEITVKSEITSFYSSYFGGSQSNTTPSCWNQWEHCQENMGVLQGHCWEPQCYSGIFRARFNARNIFKWSYGNGVLLQRKMGYLLS